MKTSDTNRFLQSTIQRMETGRANMAVLNHRASEIEIDGRDPALRCKPVQKTRERYCFANMPQAADIGKGSLEPEAEA